MHPSELHKFRKLSYNGHECCLKKEEIFTFFLYFPLLKSIGLHLSFCFFHYSIFNMQHNYIVAVVFYLNHCGSIHLYVTHYRSVDVLMSDSYQISHSLCSYRCCGNYLGLSWYECCIQVLIKSWAEMLDLQGAAAKHLDCNYCSSRHVGQKILLVPKVYSVQYPNTRN